VVRRPGSANFAGLTFAICRWNPTGSVGRKNPGNAGLSRRNQRQLAGAWNGGLGRGVTGASSRSLHSPRQCALDLSALVLARVRASVSRKSRDEQGAQMRGAA
jgi:hypothetical protein